MDFHDCTVVGGRNGSGKSLLARSLVDGLWRVNDGNDILNDGWQGLTFDLTVSLNREHCINSSGRRSRINGGEDELPADLSCFFKRIPRQIYVDTSFLPSPMDYTGESREFTTILQEILLRDKTEFHSISAHLQKGSSAEAGETNLDKSISELERALYDCDKQVQLMEIRTSRSDKLKREKNSLIDDAARMRESIAQYKKEQELMNEILKDRERASFLEKRIEEIRVEIAEEQERQKKVSEMREEIEKVFPQFKDRSGSPDLEVLQNIFLEARDLNDRMDQWKTFVDKRKTTIWKWIAGVNISLVTAVVTILLKNGLALQRDVFLCGSLALLDVILSGILFYYLRRKPLSKKEEEFNREKQEIENRLNPLLEETKIHLEGYRLSELYEFFLQYFEDYVAYSEKRRELGELEASLREGKYVRQIRNEMQTLGDEENIIRERITAGLATLCFTGEAGEMEDVQDLVRLRQGEIDILHEEIEKKEKILSGIEIDLASARDDGGNLDEKRREHLHLKQKLERKKRIREALKVSSEALQRAVAIRLESRIETFTDVVTRIYRETAPESEMAEANRSTIIEFISGGGFQPGMNPSRAYSLILAIKLALTDFLIDADMLVPLIMDDPFHTMDDERVRGFRDIVRDISGKRQIILFTHRKDLADWGHYIEL